MGYTERQEGLSGPELSPAQRTAKLVNLNYDKFAEALQGRLVVLAGSDKMAVLSKLEAWPRAKIGARWKAIGEREAGDFWSFGLKIGGRKPIQQSLIAAKDNGEIGGIIRIVRGSIYNPKDGKVTLMEKEGQLAEHFGLDKGEVTKLKFLDESDILYLVRQKGPLKDFKEENPLVDPEEVNRKFERFLEV